MFNHFRQYIVLSDSVYDKLFNWPIQFLGQLMVVVFLFYSGYGIVISANRNQNYFSSFFKHRILHTLFYYDLAVILFVLCNMFSGQAYPLKKILLSFTGWESIGNSNWFVFAIICAYISVLLAVKIRGNKVDLQGIIIVALLCLGYIWIIKKYKGEYWYDTILTFPAGLLFGYYKPTIDEFLKKSYSKVLITVITLFLIGYLFNSNIYFYEIFSIAFALLITVITYKVKIGNRFLSFMGKYSFDIYLIQRNSCYSSAEAHYIYSVLFLCFLS